MAQSLGCVGLTWQDARMRATRRPRNRRGEGYRLAEDIVAAARTIIEETGDESRVTLSEIARRVGIAAPSIYAHFDSVTAITTAAIARCWSLYDDTVLAAVDPSVGLAEAISSWAHSYVRFGRANSGIYRVLFGRDNPRPLPEVGAQAQDSLARLASAMGQLQGVAGDSPEARDSAVGLWIELHGIVVLPPAHPRFPWPDDQHLVTLALQHRGIRLEEAPDN